MNGHHYPAVAQPVRAAEFSKLGTEPKRPLLPSGVWAIRFVLLLIAFQIALVFTNQVAPLLGGAGAVRIVLRAGSFGASLLLLAWLPRSGWRHPAAGPALFAAAIVLVSVLHPTTNTLLAGVAHAALYLAVLAPLFWVPRLRVDADVFRRIVIILWGFHTLSAGMGVLQVYLPGQFQPGLSSVIAEMDPGYIESLRMTTASGQEVFRPMGLTDVPGGAAAAGFYAVLLGMALFLTDRRGWLKAACVGSMTLGMMVLYLAQIRSALAVTAVCVLAFAAILAWRRNLAKLGVLAVVLGSIVVGSLALAVSVGGEAVTSRLSTLVEGRATDVYYTNRGHFLEETIDELLPRYPFGAGLGRHGMMNNYFGNNTDPERSAIWVEIQWTAWLLDGGVLLILAYVAAMLTALWTAWGVAQRRTTGPEGDFALWGAMLVAYNIGALAWTFTFPLFMSQNGLEFWLLNAALFVAVRHSVPTQRRATA